MTAGRLRDPLSSYRLYLHKNGKYRNAATMNYVTDADGIEKRRIFIGKYLFYVSQILYPVFK
jgi:hypothetical protein